MLKGERETSRIKISRFFGNCEFLGRVLHSVGGRVDMIILNVDIAEEVDQ